MTQATIGDDAVDQYALPDRTVANNHDHMMCVITAMHYNIVQLESFLCYKIFELSWRQVDE